DRAREDRRLERGCRRPVERGLVLLRELPLDPQRIALEVVRVVRDHAGAVVPAEQAAPQVALSIAGLALSVLELAEHDLGRRILRDGATDERAHRAAHGVVFGPAVVA